MGAPQEKTRPHIGKYEVLGTLGRGSMGVVYKARDPEIGRVVALKTLRTFSSGMEQDPDVALERFRTEARSAGSLRHPNIITIFEINRDGDTPFIVMDYVEGQSLESLLAKNGAIPPMAMLYYMLQVASGLDFAHARGVIHRDIKPGNLHLDKHGRVYILDFGVAFFQKELNQASGTGAVVGTPGYMSPEQVLSEPLDYRSDLFSLAGVAFECLTGRRPFAGETFSDVMGNIIAGNLSSLSELCPDLPLALEAEFERAMQRDKALRFQSATEMIEEFCSALGVDPATVRNSPSAANLPALPRKKKSSGWHVLTSGAQKDEEAPAPPQPLRGVSISTELPAPPQPAAGRDEGGVNAWELEAKPIDLSFDRPKVRNGFSPAARPSMALGEQVEGLQRMVAVQQAENERETRSLRRLTLIFAGVCIALGSGLLFLISSGPDSGATQPVPTTEVRVGVVAGEHPAPAVVEDEGPALTLPIVEAPPPGVEPAEMTDKQLLGLIVDESAPEMTLILGIQEALRRNLVEIVDASTVALRNRSYLVRVEIIKALARMGDRRIVPELMLRLDDQDALVRGHAARALGILGDRRALGYLSMRYAREEAEQAKSAMRRAIERIQGFPLANP